MAGNPTILLLRLVHINDNAKPPITPVLLLLGTHWPEVLILTAITSLPIASNSFLISCLVDSRFV